MGTINLTINGVACTCEQGEYLWDVARRHGIGVPALCRSDAFEKHRASCRMCIVEVDEGAGPQVVASCSYPVQVECTVQTATPRIERERALMAGLMMKQAPYSQQFAERARSWGIESAPAVVGAPNVEAGARMANVEAGARTVDGATPAAVAADAGKCVLCGLCIQACQSVGARALSLVARGAKRLADTIDGNPSDTCIGCGSCASVCPAGAIELLQTDEARTIWHQEFPLAHCERCGAVVGTQAEVAYSAEKAGVEEPVLCGECRRLAVAEALRDANRYV